MNTLVYTRVLSALCIALLIAPAVASAAMVVRTGDTVSVASEEVVEGDFYGMGDTINFSGGVHGDSILLGRSITVNGSVDEDIFTAGDVVQVHSAIADDVRMIARSGTIAESVGGDVVMIGGTLTVLSSAVITGDLLVLGGKVTIEGEVQGSVFGSAEMLRIDAPIGGSIDVRVVELVLGDRAAIEGDVRYQSTQTLARATQAIVVGEVIKSDSVLESAGADFGRFLILALLAILFATLCLHLVARRQVDAIVSLTQTNTLRAPAVGITAALFLPVVIGLLVVSALGSIIGVLVFLLTLTLTVLALTLQGAVVAGWIVRYFRPGQPVSAQWVFSGTLLLYLALFIPIIGALVFVFIFLATFGALLLRLYAALR